MLGKMGLSVTWMLQGMLWDTSLLDPEEGIRFRGFSIPELQVSSLPAGFTASQQNVRLLLPMYLLGLISSDRGKCAGSSTHSSAKREP